MKKKISLTLVLALCMVLEVTKADFTFGEPINLGPTINSPSLDGTPSVTADGLSLFFNSQRSGGYGHYDVWVSTRQTTADPWGEPVNLGPTINTSSLDGCTIISPDGLTLYFASNRPGGYGGWDIYATTRASMADPWSTPTNLGPPFNSSASDSGISVTADGLTAFFDSNRPDGFGNSDIYMSTRTTPDDTWGDPVNLGPLVNSSSVDGFALVSPDGLSLYFQSNRPGGYGAFDVWVTTRPTTDDEWGAPVNLGPVINTSAFDGAATISADCSTLYFMSGRPGGFGQHDLWKAPINLIVDFNGDGIVDASDMVIMVDNWGTDNSLCDIGPMPWGDGVVDVEDLIVLAEHLFEEVP
jgi:Tol biopolymer transport system component